MARTRDFQTSIALDLLKQIFILSLSFLYIYILIYIHIYTHIEREKERGKERGRERDIDR